MAKRFTATEKWADRWFRRLPPEQKLGWLYLVDVCDLAGVVELDPELAEFQIGAEVNWQALIDDSGGRIRLLNSGKLWVTKFVGFQCRQVTEESKSAPIRAVVAALKSHGLWEEFFKGVETLPEESSKGCQTLKDKDKEKDKDKKKTRKRASSADRFTQWYELYPKHAAPEAARKAYEKAVEAISGRRDGDGGDDPEGFLIDRCGAFAKSSKGRGRYCPNPATWLNQGRYDDDPKTWQENNGHDRNFAGQQHGGHHDSGW